MGPFAKTFRYDTSGHWFKGNTHLHSVKSDGGKTFSELASLYKSADYDFLFRTDHWVCSDTDDDKQNYPLMWLDGVELDGWDEKGKLFHVVCLGKVKGIHREMGLDLAIKKAHQQDSLVILAHPGWCGNELADCLQWEFDGVEIYNHVCHWLNGKSDGLSHWNYALSQNPNTLGFAVDDSHLTSGHPTWKGGWICVNTNHLSPSSIQAGIRAGNYYSSCGPEIKSLGFDGGSLHVETSPIQYARLVGFRSTGKVVGNIEGNLFDSFEIEIPTDWQYVYLEIEDNHHRRAWTNTLFSG